MGKRFLFAAGLIIAVVVPSVAFGGTVTFRGGPPGHHGSVNFRVKRGDGENQRPKRVKEMGFEVVELNCPKSGPTHIATTVLDGFGGQIAIDAAVQHRKWHFNDRVLAAVGRSSIEHLDASIKFQGEFRKHNENKADGTLEVTLKNVDFGSGPEDCHAGLVFHALHIAPGDR